MAELDEARAKRPVPQEPLTGGPWEAIAEIGGDHFADSIYGPKGDYDGLLIARCNQGGAHSADTAVLKAAWELHEALLAAKSYIDSMPVHNWRGYDNVNRVILSALSAARVQ